MMYRLRTAGLTVKREKVVFGTQDISFMGRLVSPAGVRIDPVLTRATREFPAPLDTRVVSRFMGTVNFYHKFIIRIADLATPLNTLRKKGVSCWNFRARFFLSEIRDFCHFEDIIHSAGVPVSDPQTCSFNIILVSTDIN